MANITGWGRGTWNELAWDSPIPVVVTGVSGTSALGNESVTAGANVAVTGLVATSALGNETVVGSALVSPTTVVATGGTDRKSVV